MRGSKEQTEEERELRLVSWYLCDHFRDVFADGFSNCMVWPFEVVNPVLNTLTLEAIRLFDILSEGYSREHSRHARSQLKADLSSLAKYFTTWNESKRVAFRDGKLPGRATVSSVEENKINQYMAQQVQQEHTVFANTDVNLYTRLYENNQKKVKSLFSFAGKSFDAVKYRNEHKLRGQQDALGAFEVNHELSVGERDKRHYYRAYASAKTFTAVQFEQAMVSPGTLAKRAGLSSGRVKAVVTAAAKSCEVTEAITLPLASYMCDVVMEAHHKADARIWVDPLTGVLSFGIVAACNHSREFKGQVDVKFQMSIPEELIQPAFVSVSVSNLLDLLLGNSIVRLEHGAKQLSVSLDSKELRLVSRDGQNEDAQTLFKLHHAENGSFLLSTMPFGDAGVQWVCVRDGKLVVTDADGYGSGRFALHRLSTSYNYWVLQDLGTSKLVVVATDDSLLQVKEGSRQDAPSFSFTRPLYEETEKCLAP